MDNYIWLLTAHGCCGSGYRKTYPFATFAGAKAGAAAIIFKDESSITWMQEDAFSTLKGLIDPEDPESEYFTLHWMPLGD